MGGGLYQEIKTDKNGIIIVWNSSFSSCYNIRYVSIWFSKCFDDKYLFIDNLSSNNILIKQRKEK